MEKRPSREKPSSRYVPPSSWQELAMVSVLENIGRSPLQSKQYDMLTRLAGEDKGAEEGKKLWAAGDVTLLERKCVAIIGARKATELGRKRAYQLGYQLAKEGVVVVSGLADGIDTAALTGALEGGGRVAAVIGTPLDQAYPAKNKRLQEEIYDKHLLVSQFPKGSRVFPSNFPARNRVMAAITDASVVIEASDSSGTVHQAAECQRLGRWLGIAKSLADSEKVSWPKKFLQYEKCFVLESTRQLMAEVYS